MKCPICKEEIREDAKFCGKCGKLVPRCPSCGMVIYQKSKFCINDGVMLPENILSLFDEDQTADPVKKELAENLLKDEPTVNLLKDKPMAKEEAIINSVEEEPVIKKMRFCIRCGKECGEGQVLCQDCQNYQEDVAEDSVRNIPKSSKEQPVKVKKSKAPVIIVIVVIIIGLGAGFGGYGWYGGKLDSIIGRNGEKVMNDVQESDKEAKNADQKETESEKIDDKVVGELPEEETKENDKENIKGDSEGAAQAENDEKKGTESGIAGDTKDDTEAAGIAGDDTSVIAGDEIKGSVEYFIMNCDKKYFTNEDLASFDAEMCRIARNGIYARLGREFEDEDLARYFSQFEWYNPTITAEDFSESLLNLYQIANRDLIVAYEEEKGYR